MNGEALAADCAEESYEIINGEVVMRAAASIPHIRIQSYLARKIGNYLEGKTCEVFPESKVVFDDKTSFVPDLLVICDPSKVKDTYIEGAPDFIVEVLSLSTQSRDYGIKKNTYEKYGVKEYWIIDPLARNIIVHRLNEGKYDVVDVYHSFTEREWGWLTEEERAKQKKKVKPSLWDDLEIDVSEVFQGKQT